MNQRFRAVTWGVLFLAAAAFIVLQLAGVIEKVSVLKIVFAVVLAGAVINSIPRLYFFGMFMPAAVICIIFSDEWGISSFSPWAIIAIAVCLSIGCELIFKSFRKPSMEMHFERRSSDRQMVTEYINNSEKHFVDCNNSFASKVKYVKLEDFQSADLKTSFGELSVYFDGSKIPSGTATIAVSAKFGAIKLYLPREWRTDIKAKESFGSIKEVSEGAPNADAPEVIITGEAAFGSVEIYHI